MIDKAQSGNSLGSPTSNSCGHARGVPSWTCIRRRLGISVIQRLAFGRLSQRTETLN